MSSQTYIAHNPSKWSTRVFVQPLTHVRTHTSRTSQQHLHKTTNAKATHTHTHTHTYTYTHTHTLIHTHTHSYTHPWYLHIFCHFSLSFFFPLFIIGCIIQSLPSPPPSPSYFLLRSLLNWFPMFSAHLFLSKIEFFWVPPFLSRCRWYRVLPKKTSNGFRLSFFSPRIYLFPPVFF